MTKDRLYSLSYENLIVIAKRENITILQDADKDFLVHALFEAFEENRIDHEESSSPTIQVEAKKYRVSQDEELFLDFDNDVILPLRYYETDLILMLRDPSWGYCYWDFDNTILEKHSIEGITENLFLRVIELVASDWEKDSVVDWFDIPIRMNDFSRYINLPNEDAFYGVAIYSDQGNEETLIIRSNIIENSRDYMRPVIGNKENDNQDLLIKLSGFSRDIGSFPGANLNESGSPQRILSQSNTKKAY